MIPFCPNKVSANPRSHYHFALPQDGFSAYQFPLFLFLSGLISRCLWLPFVFCGPPISNWKSARVVPLGSNSNYYLLSPFQFHTYYTISLLSSFVFTYLYYLHVQLFSCLCYNFISVFTSRPLTCISVCALFLSPSALIFLRLHLFSSFSFRTQTIWTIRRYRA